MEFIASLSIIAMAATLISTWWRRDPRVWGSLLSLSLVLGWIGHIVKPSGIALAFTLLLVWQLYRRSRHWLAFLLVILYSCLFKLHILPGFDTFSFTPHFSLGIESPLVGVFPLAFVAIHARSVREVPAILKGFGYGLVGIAILALLATLAKATHWQVSAPSEIVPRLIANLLLTCIAEEAFFRGFVQKKLHEYWVHLTLGPTMALILSSILFTLIHIFWSPNIPLLGFVFLASILYGSVYLISKRIESAILTHFALNLMHMLFFSYHAA